MDIVDAQSWKSLTNKKIYLSKTESLPTAKVEVDAGVSYHNVWRIIQLPVLESSMRDIMYLLVHNKLPVRERLYRAGLVNDPNCNACPSLPVCDKAHYFTSCVRVSNVWNEVKQKIVHLLGFNVVDDALINLTFPKCKMESEIVWLLGHYFALAWTELYIKGGDEFKGDKFFGFLRFKYKADQLGSRQKLHYIPGL